MNKQLVTPATTLLKNLLRVQDYAVGHRGGGSRSCAVDAAERLMPFMGETLRKLRPDYADYGHKEMRRVYEDMIASTKLPNYDPRLPESEAGFSPARLRSVRVARFLQKRDRPLTVEQTTLLLEATGLLTEAPLIKDQGRSDRGLFYVLGYEDNPRHCKIGATTQSLEGRLRGLRTGAIGLRPVATVGFEEGRAWQFEARVKSLFAQNRKDPGTGTEVILADPWVVLCVVRQLLAELGEDYYTTLDLYPV